MIWFDRHRVLHALVPHAAALVILASGPLALAQEWYIPKRPEVLEPQRFEIGLRAQFTTDSDGLLDSQELSAIGSLRISPFDRFEVYAEVPYTFAERDRIVGFDIEANRHDDIGDVFSQFTYELFRGDDWALLPSVDVIFPTGRDPYDHPVGTGGGHYRFTPGVTYMKVIDPVVVFAYVGHQISLSESFDVGRVSPGGSTRFRVGGA